MKKEWNLRLNVTCHKTPYDSFPRRLYYGEAADLDDHHA
jgi:hypothetical protein